MALIAITLSIVLIFALNTSDLSISKTQQAFTAANCDKADLEINGHGNMRGNAKQCGFLTEGPKEPVRDCDSPNALKDNDDVLLLKRY